MYKVDLLAENPSRHNNLRRKHDISIVTYITYIYLPLSPNLAGNRSFTYDVPNGDAQSNITMLCMENDLHNKTCT